MLDINHRQRLTVSGSTVVLLCRVGGGCLYTVIQWEPPLAFYRVEIGRIELSTQKCAYTEDNDTRSFTRKRP